MEELKRQRKKDVFFEEQLYILDELSLERMIELLTEKVPKGRSLSECFVELDYGNGISTIELYYYRDETDEEVKERLDAMTLRQKRRLERFKQEKEALEKLNLI